MRKMTNEEWTAAYILQFGIAQLSKAATAEEDAFIREMCADLEESGEERNVYLIMHDILRN